MKTATITIIVPLITALLHFAPVEAGNVLAMGAKGDAVQSRDNKTGESQSEENQGKQTGDALSTKGSNTKNMGKTSPEKRPRLKYRDEPGCSC